MDGLLTQDGVSATPQESLRRTLADEHPDLAFALLSLLATRFGAGVGSVLAITVRLANTLGEFLAIGLVELVYLTRRKTGLESRR